MLDAFIDLARVTRSHIPATNVPAKMDVPNGSHPRKRKPTTQAPEEPTVIVGYSFYATHEKILYYRSVLEETNHSLENRDISIYYASLDDVWCRNERIVDNALAYAVATEIMLNDDIEPCSIDECQRKTNWSNWK
ncbi:hypothetical protein EV1_003196 [Malus domestica]